MVESANIVGVFESRDSAKQAINELRQAGFSDDQIGFVVPHVETTEEIGSTNKTGDKLEERASAFTSGIVGGVMGTIDAFLLPVVGPTDAGTMLQSTIPMAEQAVERVRHIGDRSTGPAEDVSEPESAPNTVSEENRSVNNSESNNAAVNASEVSSTERETETEGAVAGGVVGGILGAVAALFIPGIGPIVAGGALLAALSGAAIGTVAGGILGAFTGMGLPGHLAQHYNHEVQSGRSIVTVHVENQQQEVLDILRHNGAHDVQTHLLDQNQEQAL